MTDKPVSVRVLPERSLSLNVAGGNSQHYVAVLELPSNEAQVLADEGFVQKLK